MGTTARWIGWAGRAFLVLAALALVGAVAGIIVSRTVLGAAKGCEECEPHITVVLLSLTLLLASVLCGIVGAVLYFVSARAARTHGQRSRSRKSRIL
jgi:hypothetical protein